MVQVMPQGAGAHALTGTTLTLFRLPNKMPSLVSVDTPFGDHFEDGAGHVEKASRWFDHTRAKALGVEERQFRLDAWAQTWRDGPRMNSHDRSRRAWPGEPT